MDPDAMYPGFSETGLTSAEIQSLLDEFECPGRTVKGIHDTIEAGQSVVFEFYFGPNGPDGLMPEVFERYVYIENMFKKDTRWWIENVATCGAPDNAYMGQEVHLYGLTRKQIECFVRCGTPRPPDFILRMDGDEFDMVGLRDTIQTSQLRAWEIQKRREIQNAYSRGETAPSGVKTCRARGCADAGTKRCSVCRAAYYCSKECQKTHWKEHKKECHKMAAMFTQIDPTQVFRL